MSNDRYEKIRKALEMGPTHGPWKVGDQNGHCGISIGSDDALVAPAYLRLITSRARWGEEHFAMPENQEAVANAALIASCDPDTIRALLEERDALREALSVLVNWTPSADTYRRMGFDPETPMRAHEAAKAVLAKGEGT